MPLARSNHRSAALPRALAAAQPLRAQRTRSARALHLIATGRARRRASSARLVAPAAGCARAHVPPPERAAAARLLACSSPTPHHCVHLRSHARPSASGAALSCDALSRGPPPHLVRIKSGRVVAGDAVNVHLWT
jgi:hypothetical protein